METPALSLTGLGAYLKRDIAPLGRAARWIASATHDDGLKGKLSAVRAKLEKMAENQT